MLIELKTKRRWILSILEAVAEQSDGRVVARATVKHSSTRRIASPEMGLSARLKAATRPLADTGR